MNNRMSLHIGSTVYTGWKEISVTASVDAIAGSFRMTAAPRMTDSEEHFPDLTGYPCEVRIGRHGIVSGYIDTTDGVLEESNTDIQISGRDKTGDLVDCSAVLPSGGVKNQSLEQVVSALVKPYGIKLTVSAATGDKFSRFAIQQGETVFEAIDRACRLRGILPQQDGSGGIILTKIGATRSSTNLIEGVNVKRFRHHRSTVGRFSTYKVLGQSTTTENHWGAKAYQPSATVTDTEIRRHRPIIIVAEGQITAATARTRAEWELAVRIGKSRTITVTVPGWLQDSGEPWRPNILTGVKCPWLHIDEMQTLLIGAVEYTYSESDGELAELTLTSPDAYIPEQQKEKKAKGKVNPFAGLPK